MKFSNFVSTKVALSCLLGRAVSTPLASTHHLSPRAINPVVDSQNVSAPAFIGSPSTGQKLRAKERFTPDALQAHIDGGNTRSDDFPGPLGVSPAVTTNQVPVSYMFWENTTSVMASVNCGTTSNPRFCLAALDPETLEPLGQWEPTDRNVVSNYWQIIDNRISLPTQEGFIVELERSGNSFNVIREIDVSGHLPQGSILAQVGYTGDGNLWFAATPVPLLGLDGTNTTTIGYAAADDSLHAISIVDELFENAFAVNGNSIYVVTGPAGPKDTRKANGQFYAFQAGATDGVTVVYNETYSAGSGFKPGGLSRGSGASVGLLGQKYVAITDNADVQVNLVVYRQAEEAALAGSAFACSIPLFQPNASGNEAGLTTHFDGSTYSALIINSYGSRTFLDQSSSDINGPQNNNSAASPGITRINVSDDGTCSLAWDLPVVGTMTTLSTETGILYAYLQDMDFAVKGEYVYYFAAIDWATGEEMWRAKAGAGGVFRPGISHVQLGPNGRLYQGVAGGVAWVEDAPTAASVLRYLGF